MSETSWHPMTENDCAYYAEGPCVGGCGFPPGACRCGDDEAEAIGPEGERPATPEQRAAAARLFDHLTPIEEL